MGSKSVCVCVWDEVMKKTIKKHRSKKWPTPEKA